MHCYAFYVTDYLLFMELPNEFMPYFHWQTGQFRSIFGVGGCQLTSALTTNQTEPLSYHSLTIVCQNLHISMVIPVGPLGSGSG
jgi:hypothetical protein